MQTKVTGLDSLSFAEKLRLVEDLWDDIAISQELLPIPHWLEGELAHRREEYLRDPGSAIPWEEAKARLLRGEA